MEEMDAYLATMASPMWPSLRLSPSAPPEKSRFWNNLLGAHGAFAGCDAGDDLRTGWPGNSGNSSWPRKDAAGNLTREFNRKFTEI